MKKITGIVLAGGKSSRMGKDKALIPFQGKTMIEHSIDMLKNVCHAILICSNNPDHEAFGYPVIKDRYKNIGPVGGIEAALSKSETEMNLFAPCDSPCLKTGLYEKILENTAGFDAVVPRLKNGRIEPLTAYYSKRILPEVRRGIENGDFKMQNLLQNVNTGYILVKEAGMFRNMNAPGDLLNEVENAI